MIGRIVAGLVVIGLAVGVWTVWPRDDSGPTATSATTTSTTSTTDTETTTTTVASTTTTGPPEAGIIDTVEEAEAVLTELWFGWFEGIYNQDVDRIKEVVASQARLDSAVSAFSEMEFDSVPTRSGIHVSDIEMLRADDDCTAVWAHLEVSFRGGASQSVQILRVVDGQWKSVSSWVSKDDLWEMDCDSQLEPLE
jgi:hypothetical protein